MTHHDLVQFAGTYGQLYMLALFFIAVGYALWPSNRDKFERAARRAIDDTPNPPSEPRP